MYLGTQNGVGGQCVLQMGPRVTGSSAGLLLITFLQMSSLVNLLMIRLCLHLGSIVTLPTFSGCFLPASVQAYGTPLPSQSLC